MNALRILTVILLAASLNAAGAPSLSVTPDRTKVALGEQIVLTVKIESANDLKGAPAIKLPDSEHYSVVRSSGPSRSSMTQIVNGKVSHSISLTYTYHIAPRKTGAFTFPALSIKLKNQTLSSQPFRVSVTNKAVKNPDVKVYLIAGKRTCYVGEQVHLTLKVAKKANSAAELVREGFITIIDRISESLGRGFSVNALFDRLPEATAERIEGEVYHVFKLHYALFPQRSGAYTIRAIPFQYVERQRVRSRRGIDPFFDGFFGMRDQIRQVPKTVLTSTITFTVKSLPPGPPSFSGAVGKFRLEADIQPRSVPTGESATLSIKLAGNSRPNSMGEVTLPDLSSFEIFTPEKHAWQDTTATGIHGRKSYKYLIIPKEAGDLAVPPVVWTYFDPDAATYTTLSSDTFHLRISKGKDGGKQSSTRYMTQAEIREVGKDIRYIKTVTDITNQPTKPYTNPIFFILYPLPFLLGLFSALYKVQSGRSKDEAAGLRQKAARRAFKDIQAIEKEQAGLSFKEMLSRIAGVIERYISHKFGFSATGKMLGELKQELIDRGIAEKVVSDLTEYIEQMDRYRFGGSSPGENDKSEMLAKTRSFVQQLDKSPKKERGA
ncbi:MAG: hypothetical protein GF398_08415 [Chitinivibrionales bacterium]|nr:hypothetical protein [Chitinivibrionales bacterium]